ncbi:MAG: vWA domain-containing protein [Acidimicrobiales bacterium]
MADAAGARLVVAFAASLRAAGLDVPPGSVVLFAQALGAVGLHDREQVYWAGRSTLIRRPEDRDLYDRLFAEFFDHRGEQAVARVPRSVALELDSGRDDDAGGDARTEEPEAREPTLTVRYSALEVLRRQDFALYRDDEWAEARRLIASLRARPESRRSRRLRGATRGNSLDLPRTVRAALGSDGEALRRAWRTPSTRPRRLVFLIDISGSMEPYARAFLRFAHASVVSRPAGGVEVFVLGTRVTRITRPLSSRDPDAALADASRLVDDWYGGTRLGEGLRSFNDRWGSRGMARGAIVVILSDGWDRGDPSELSDEMRRLRRVAHRVVWVNPLRASPGYAPLARGMAAALPFVDEFVDGHSIASLEELVEVVSGPAH